LSNANVPSFQRARLAYFSLFLKAPAFHFRRIKLNLYKYNQLIIRSVFRKG
jgi:hypothetical protein